MSDLFRFGPVSIEADAGGREIMCLRESQIEKRLVAHVKALGGEVRKVQWIARRGAPDRLVLFGTDKAERLLAEVIGTLREDPDRRVDEAALLRDLIGAALTFVELKAPGVKPEDYQLREHERMRKMGQRVVVIDSIDGVDRLLS